MTELRRLPDWQSRLRRWLSTVSGHPLIPGQHDCCLFGAGAILAQTGVDIAAGWRGRYTTFAGGRRMLRKAGYADHVALIAAHLPEAHVSQALAGDIAIAPGDGGEMVGVVQGAGVYVLAANGKLGVIPMAPVLRLFKVGD